MRILGPARGLLFGLAALSGLTLSQSAQADGDRVLAQWSNGKWYPAQIATYRGGRYHIRFDDGDTARVTERQVRPFSWHEGTRVECKWQQGRRYHSGHITAIRGSRVRVQYDDGDREVTHVRFCRSATAGAGYVAPPHIRESSRGVPSDPKAFLRAINRNRARQSGAYVVPSAPRGSRSVPSHIGESARDVASDPDAFLRAIERNIGQ